MSPEERRAQEVQLDRALRRGELAEAVATLRALSAAFPEEAALASRLAELESHLEPQDLRPRRRVSADAPPAGDSPMHAAEAQAARGDFAGAIATYRQLLQGKPDSELVKERLAELFALAQARSTPRQSVSREQVLEYLLGRISTRRRS